VAHELAVRLQAMEVVHSLRVEVANGDHLVLAADQERVLRGVFERMRLDALD